MNQLALRLLSLGWQVEAEGKPIRTAGSFSFSVTSGVDWFDLEGVCDFDGQSVPLPKLLAAPRKGERFVTLDDGSRGMLAAGVARAVRGPGPIWATGRRRGRSAFAPRRPSLGRLAGGPGASHRRRHRLCQAPRKTALVPTASGRRTNPGFVGTCATISAKAWAGCTFSTILASAAAWPTTWDWVRRFRCWPCSKSARREKPARPKRAAGGPSLVVVPRSLVFNWIEEARRFTPELRVLNYTGLDRGAAWTDSTSTTW